MKEPTKLELKMLMQEDFNKRIEEDEPASTEANVQSKPPETPAALPEFPSRNIDEVQMTDESSSIDESEDKSTGTNVLPVVLKPTSAMVEFLSRSLDEALKNAELKLTKEALSRLRFYIQALLSCIAEKVKQKYERRNEYSEAHAFKLVHKFLCGRLLLHAKADILRKISEGRYLGELKENDVRQFIEEVTEVKLPYNVIICLTSFIEVVILEMVGAIRRKSKSSSVSDFEAMKGIDSDSDIKELFDVVFKRKFFDKDDLDSE